MSTVHLARWVVIAAVLFSGASDRARAGTIKITGAQPGTPIIFTFAPGIPQPEGGTLTTTTGEADAKGTSTLVAGTNAAEKAYTGVITITKTPTGKTVPQTSNLKLSPTGTTLGNLEPFTFPGFTADVSLSADIDLEALLSSGTTFTLGEDLTVVDGTISQTSAITFEEGGSPFSGTATVSSFDDVAPIPEPSSLPLLATGVFASLGVAVIRWADIRERSNLSIRSIRG